MATRIRATEDGTTEVSRTIVDDDDPNGSEVIVGGEVESFCSTVGGQVLRHADADAQNPPRRRERRGRRQEETEPLDGILKW